MNFAAFMSSAFGRLLRVVAGLALIGGGLYLALATPNAITGIVLIVVGFVPFGAGLINVCVFAPLFGGPFSGAKLHHGV